MRQLRPRRVLEFGPGHSTIALVDGGAEQVDTCEDRPDWAAVWKERMPATVRVLPYDFGDPLRVPDVAERYDLGFVDGPRGNERRPAVIGYCLHRCAAVLVCTEDWRPDAGRRSDARPLEDACRQLAREHGRILTVETTGPYSGGFALLQ